MNAVRPVFNDQRRISIKEGRHPLLDPKKVVPVTVRLGDDFRLLIITGPNTGGKTVSLKTVGLFTLMDRQDFISRPLKVPNSVFLAMSLQISEMSRALNRVSVLFPPI